VIAGFRTPNPPSDIWSARLICFALACFFLLKMLG